MRRYYTILFFILFFLFISPWFTYFLVTIPTPCGLGFITTENQYTWIGFFGAIIGGGATLIGVWWTLFQQKKDKYDSTDPMLLMTIQTIQNSDELTLIKKFKNVGDCNAEIVNVIYISPPPNSRGAYDGAKLLPPKFESYAFISINCKDCEDFPLYYECIVTWESKYKKTNYKAKYQIRIDHSSNPDSYITSINLFDLEKTKMPMKKMKDKKLSKIN